MEIVAALAILVGIVSTVLVVMNHAVESTVEMRNRRRAFEVARENLESLLTVTSVSDSMEYGYSETYPEIQWELRVEPFYEPISNKMWIRAVSSASFRDANDEDQTIELEQWLTGLTAQQIKQILDQQETEEKILEELYGDKDNEIQEATKVCLEQAGLHVAAYEDLLRRQRREKLDYLIENGFDDGYEQLLEAMEADESVLLRDLGADFDQLDACINLLLENPHLLPGVGNTPEAAEDPLVDPPSEQEDSASDICRNIDCSAIAQELRPVICQLMKCCCE